MAQAQMAWYVLRAVSGKEMKVKEYIDAEIKNGRLGGHVSQVLIPTEKVKALRGNKQVIKERLYLPGYVRQNWLVKLFTSCVAHLMCWAFSVEWITPRLFARAR